MVVARSCLSPDDKRVDADGTGIARNRAVRDSSRHDAVSGQQGFTLIEALVVVAIVGLISAAVALSVNKYWQRARLEGSANDVRNFLLTAQNLAIATNDRVTVRLQQEAGSWVFEMVPARMPPVGSPLREGMQRRLVLPPYLVLDGLSLGGGSDWTVFPTGVRNLACTPNSRTQQETATGVFADITGTRTLRLTHTSIVDGSLQPRTVFQIEVSPLWNVRILRRRAP